MWVFYGEYVASAMVDRNFHAGGLIDAKAGRNPRRSVPRPDKYAPPPHFAHVFAVMDIPAAITATCGRSRMDADAFPGV
jgi:hypothetical protein